MTYLVICELCLKPVDADSRYTWHRVEGWEREGKAGGSDIALRRRVGKEFAHNDCIRKEQRRLPAAQEAML